MLKPSHFAAVAVVCVAMGACNAKTDKGNETGDNTPVATLDGKTITVGDVKAELGQSPAPTNPEAAAALNKQALQNIIDRELMARAAEAQKIDKSPGFQRDSQFAQDGAKAAALAKQLVTKTPPPSAATVDKFIADNPRAFKDRKFLVVDELEVVGPPPTLPSEPLKNLEDYEALFAKTGVAYQRKLELVDSGAADPKFLDNLLSLPPNAVFQVNNGRRVTVNQIREVRPSPLTGAGAVAIAKAYLQNQAAEAATRDYLDGLRKDAKTKIRYEPGYEPETPKS